MSLKSCRVCGKPVSGSANKCPHCGEKNPTLKRWKEMGTGEKVAYGTLAGGFSAVSAVAICGCLLVILIILMMFI